MRQRHTESNKLQCSVRKKNPTMYGSEEGASQRINIRKAFLAMSSIFEKDNRNNKEVKLD